MKKLVTFLTTLLYVCNLYSQNIPAKTIYEKLNNEEIAIMYYKHTIVLEKKDFVFDEILYKKEKEGSMSVLSTTFSHEKILPQLFLKVLGHSLMDSLITEGETSFSFSFYVKHNGEVCNLALSISNSPIVKTIPIQKWLDLYAELLKIKFDILKPGLDIPYYRNGFGYTVKYFGQYIPSI